MAAQTWLAEVLRVAGITVVEHAGWQSRAVGGAWAPFYGVVHATAAPRSQPDETQVRLVRDGHSTLAGPIANACIDRAGRWHVVAGGRCNSTLDGTAGPFKGKGNSQALSTEACNDNVSEPWPDVQYQAYVRGWAAWCRRLGWTSSKLVGHKEHCPGRKSDPTFNMATFRADVAQLLAGGAVVNGKDRYVEPFTITDGPLKQSAGLHDPIWRMHVFAETGAQFEQWRAGRPVKNVSGAAYADGALGTNMVALPALLAELRQAPASDGSGGVSEARVREIAREVVDSADIRPGD